MSEEIKFEWTCSSSEDEATSDCKESSMAGPKFRFEVSLKNNSKYSVLYRG